MKEEMSSFWSEGGEMNYYFIYGPQMEDVVTSYTDLTGKPDHHYGLWAIINVNGVIIRKVT
jgi:alpha-glucosidase